jgi:hypothetical protein
MSMNEPKAETISNLLCTPLRMISKAQHSKLSAQRNKEKNYRIQLPKNLPGSKKTDGPQKK